MTLIKKLIFNLDEEFSFASILFLKLKDLSVNSTPGLTCIVYACQLSGSLFRKTENIPRDK